MRLNASVAVIVLCAVFLAVLLFWGADLIGGPPDLRVPDSVAPDGAPAHLQLMLTATDQTVTMLTTLALGLIVLVGFTLKLAEARFNAITTVDRVAGLAFIAALLATVFYGFAARRLAFELANAEYQDWTWVQGKINLQALFLALATALGFFLSLRSLERIRDHALLASPPAPVPAATSATRSRAGALAKGKEGGKRNA